MLGLNRSSLDYEPAGDTPENLRLRRLIDEPDTACPFYDSRRIMAWLTQQGEGINRKRVQRLIAHHGPGGHRPLVRLSAAGRGHRVDPYGLRGVRIERPGQVWSGDITDVPMATGLVDLTTTIDWSSR